MDAYLRRAERDDPLRYFIAYARLIGAQYAGNITKNTEQLWLLRACGKVRQCFNDGLRERRIQKKIALRMEAKRIWFGKLIRNRKHNVEVHRDWEHKYFRYNERAGGHIEIDLCEYMNSKRAGETWFSMSVARNE